MPQLSPPPPPKAKQRTTVRGRVDYRMTRRTVLHEVQTGERDVASVTDAHRELRMAGEHLGTRRDEPCPVCGTEGTLANVHYAFPGRGPSRASGRAMTMARLVPYVLRHGETRVYTVEVCHACGWHHLLEGYWLVPKKPGAATPRPRATLRSV